MTDLNLEVSNNKIKLELLEATIDNFMNSRWDAAAALIQINEAKLYSQENFKEYVRERFDMNKDWAYKLIDWYVANNAIGRNSETAISVNAAKILAPIAKKNPKKLEAVNKLAEILAADRGQINPTADDYKAAKKKVMPHAAKTSKPKDEYCFAVGLDTAGEKEFKKTFKAAGHKIKKDGSKLIEITEDPRAFLRLLGSMLGSLDNIELTISVNRKVAKKAVKKVVKKTAKKPANLPKNSLK